MDIQSIYLSPSIDGVLSAYRQVRFEVLADALCPPDQPMYADVYVFSHNIGDFIFYKTLTAYSTANVGGYSMFIFDAQDAYQEYLQTYLVGNASVTSVLQMDVTPPTRFFDYHRCETIVKFRGSTFSGSVIVPNGPVPVQGTFTTLPVSGGGTASDQFIVVNAAMPPDRHIFTNGLVSPWSQHITPASTGTYLTDTEIYPMSNLPKNSKVTPSVDLCPEIWQDDYGGFPIYVKKFGDDGVHDRYTRTCNVVLQYGSSGNTSSFSATLITGVTVSAGMYYLPLGLADILSFLSTGSFAYGFLTNPGNDPYYRISLFDFTASRTAFISPMYKAQTSTMEHTQLLFLNMYGVFEPVSFTRTTEEHKVNSTEQFVPWTEEFISLTASANPLTVGRKRYNVRGFDEISLKGRFLESVMQWLKELMRSPLVYLVDSVANCSPVEVIDDTFRTRKTIIEGRNYYEVTVKIRPAIDYVGVRN